MIEGLRGVGAGQGVGIVSQGLELTQKVASKLQILHVDASSLTFVCTCSFNG